MAKIRRVIRKVQPAAHSAIDEEFWPVILATFVLCGFLMGMAIAYLPFRARPWWQSGVVWLFVIPIVTCLTIWCLRKVSARLLRRALQVSIVLCLLVHAILFVITWETSIFGRIWDRATRVPRRSAPRETRIVYTYQPFQLNETQRQQQEFVQPVEMQVPDPIEEQVERQETPQERPVTEAPSMPSPAVQQNVQQNSIERPRPAETSPRQSDQPSRLSRQTLARQPAPANLVTALAPTPRQPSASSQVESQAANLQRRDTNLPAPQTTAVTDPVTMQPTETVAMTRRAVQNSPTLETTSAPTLQRQVATPTAVPRTDLRTGETATIARQTAPQPLDASRTTTISQTTAAPRVEQVAVQPTVDQPSVAVAPASQREQPSERQPQLAQTPIPVPNRQSRVTPRPEPSTTAAQVASNNAPTQMPTRDIEAHATSVARAATKTPPGQPSVRAEATSVANRPPSTSVPRRTNENSPAVADASAERSASRSVSGTRAVPQTSSLVTAALGSEAGASGAAALASGNTSVSRQPAAAAANHLPQAAANVNSTATNIPLQVARTERSDSPAGIPGAVAESRLSRSTPSSAVATARTAAVENPSTVAAETGADRPLANPSRLAMTKSLAGIAGVGQTPNLDRSPTTPGAPSLVASGSARRTEATQNMPAGPALAPGDAPLARRMLAGANLPGSPVQATTNSVAETAGDMQTSELASSASASLSRTAANAKQGEVSAAPGNVEVDLGPTRVADAGGLDRAAGGGQPELNFDSDAKQLARARSGGTAAVALSVPQIAAQVTVPNNRDQSPGGQLSAASGSVTQANTSAPLPATEITRSTPESATPGSGTSNAEKPIASSGIARADTRSDQPAFGQAGEGVSSEEEEEEEKLRRLGRRSGAHGMTLAVSGPATTVDAPSSASGGSNEPSRVPLAESAATGVNRTVAGETSGPATAASTELTVAGGVSGGELASDRVVSRAEAVDATVGPAILGGGSSALQRAAMTRDLAAHMPAPLVSLSGAAQSSGQPNGSNATNQGIEPVATAAGVIGRPTSGPVGVAAGPLPHDAVAQQGTDAIAGPSSRATASVDGPMVGESPRAGAPLNRANTARFNASATVAITPATPEASTTLALAGSNNGGVNADTTPMERQATGGIPVDLNQAEGPGGLGPQVSVDVGINTRHAQRDSLQVQPTPARFIRKEVGGAPALNTAAVFSAEAYRGRGARTPGNQPGGNQGAAGPQTEAAIELGLAYLARQQLPDGSWSLQLPGETVGLSSDTAATGLTLLAFQGAGYNHREYKYAAQVAAGLAYLLRNQKPDGDLFVPVDDNSNRSVWLYSHAIAAIALCEAYGMTQDPQLAEPAQRAIDFIAAAQDTKKGGWRYQPGVESDTSVTGWMMMALKSGELAGLKVPTATYEGIGRWLDTSQASGSQRHEYRYNPFAPDTDAQRHGRLANPTMTAVGLLMRLYGGWRRDNADMMKGAEYLGQHPPAIGSVRDPKRDTYYWYYATQVMFHMGGEHWNKWHGQLHPLLIESQIQNGDKAGSWSPRTPIPDRWSSHAGRLYITTMNLLSLEVSYRHLPLYEDTSK